MRNILTVFIRQGSDVIKNKKPPKGRESRPVETSEQDVSCREPEH